MEKPLPRGITHHVLKRDENDKVKYRLNYNGIMLEWKQDLSRTDVVTWVKQCMIHKKKVPSARPARIEVWTSTTDMTYDRVDGIYVMRNFNTYGYSWNRFNDIYSWMHDTVLHREYIDDITFLKILIQRLKRNCEMVILDHTIWLKYLIQSENLILDMKKDKDSRRRFDDFVVYFMFSLQEDFLSFRKLYRELQDDEYRKFVDARE